ncbi:hypothetical protein EDB82DRAFT_453927 [Fusarium venenatum]|uniref:uncharacterized protein n=1 Tax=Fusarium venenatum TaxID=56646 RepID=UPI001E00D9B4|nr:hypothetical protein EDB82DRAFT_453927 [Fusarium venenatum]
MAIGLFGLDSTLAGPCKARTSTTDAVTSTLADSTTQSPTTTAGEISAVASSETLTGTVATTIALDTTAAITTTTSETETTTAAAVTTAAPLATPNFTITGDGGSVNGGPLQGVDQNGSVMLFCPEGGNLRTRTLTLDPKTGRLRDKYTGNSVCVYYGSANSPSDPAYFGYCQNGNTGPNTAFDYVTRDIFNGKLACTAPKASCPTDDDGNPLGCSTDPSSDVHNQFYYKYEARNGYYLYISSGSPSCFTPIDLNVHDV